MCLSTGGGYPIQPWTVEGGGTPSQVQGGTHLRSRWGGYPISGPGGVPHLRSRWGGYPISGPGGVPHLRSRWGVPHPRSRGVPHPRSGGKPHLRSRGVPHLRSGGEGGTPSQVWGGPWVPPQVMGTNFDTRFGLIHVQTGKKKFSQRVPPPPPQ